MTDRRWVYQRCGEAHGPLDITDLRAAAFLGFLKPDDLVRDIASDTWIAAASMAQIGTAFPGGHKPETEARTTAHDRPAAG